ncbi:MAG TPA: hypothetical protein VLR27_00085 [Acidimicrobiales bacterium]|nr:hypothetical protein [Acidimicrobiales bacterium]
MSISDGSHAPVRGTLAVVAGPDVDAGVLGILAAAGHEVRCLPGLPDAIALARTEPVAVLAVAAEALDEAHAAAGRWTSALPGVGELFALHRADDVPSMWRSYRRGAVPWVLGSTSVPGLAPPEMSGPDLALDALHEELVGRHTEACRLLAAIRDQLVIAEAIEVLVAAGASALERLRGRSRYPVPADLLVQHLPPHVGTLEGVDFALWWGMVESVAFRASGLRLPAFDLDLAERPHAVAFGAFHAASTIVRFTARRQWRQPVDLLGDLAAVE